MNNHLTHRLTYRSSNAYNKSSKTFMSFIEELWEFIETAGGIMPGTKGHYRSLASRHIPYSTFYSSLKRLEKKGLIKSVKNSRKQTVFVISAKGKELLHKKTGLTPRTDGFATLIAFDIPETKRRERRLFQRYLLRNSYIAIQKSLYISRHKIASETLDLINELKLKNFIKIISGRIDYLKI